MASAWYKDVIKPVCVFILFFLRNLLKSLYYISRLKIDFVEFSKQTYIFIFSVLTSVILISIAIGIVLGVQIGPEFVSRGLGSKFGILSSLTMSRELIPVLASMMIATQYGTGLASEIANMKVTQQIDALKVLNIDPIYYLVVPRILAVVIFMPLILWFATVVSVYSSYFVVWIKTGLVFNSFASSILDYFAVKDILLCLFKSSVFGLIIVMLSATNGLIVEGGAKDVGKATTNTVILSFVTIIIVDLLITALYLK